MNRFCESLVLVASVAILAGCASTQPGKTSLSATSIAFSPDQRLLAYANATEIQVVDIESRKQISTLREVPENPDEADPAQFRHGTGDSMVFLDNSRIASTGMGGLVTIWDIDTEQRLLVIGQSSEEAQRQSCRANIECEPIDRIRVESAVQPRRQIPAGCNLKGCVHR